MRTTTGTPLKGIKRLRRHLLSGPEELQAKTKLLIEEYKDIFCDKLNKVPAKLQPMTLTVDNAKWDSKRNRLPPRPMSTAKQKEIKNQVEQMLDLTGICHSPLIFRAN